MPALPSAVQEPPVPPDVDVIVTWQYIPPFWAPVARQLPVPVLVVHEAPSVVQSPPVPPLAIVVGAVVGTPAVPLVQPDPVK